AGGRAGGQAVVDDHDVATGERNRVPTGAPPPTQTAQLRRRGGDAVRQRLVGQARPDPDALVDDGRTALGDRPDGRFGLAGDGYLADRQHVEVGMQGGGDQGGDRDTTPRQAENQGRLGPGVFGRPHGDHRQG